MELALQIRPYQFALVRPLQTAAGVINTREGWLLRFQTADGRLGWGEVAPLQSAHRSACETALLGLASACSVKSLEHVVSALPAEVAFGVGAALAELTGWVGSPSAEDWLAAPESAELLPSGMRMLARLDDLVEVKRAGQSLTVKWKVAVEPDHQERHWLEQLLQKLPPGAQLRLDANGGWDRSTAQAWMDRLVGEPSFAWLEQPLPPEDQSGLELLARRGPVALDESLTLTPRLRQQWDGWQVRRPSQEGDPRPLLQALRSGQPRWMLSTAFETGIGRRWLNHLAALQWLGPTPAAPGLAPGWCPEGPLFSVDPEQVWRASS